MFTLLKINTIYTTYIQHVYIYICIQVLINYTIHITTYFYHKINTIFHIIHNIVNNHILNTIIYKHQLNKI